MKINNQDIENNIKNFLNKMKVQDNRSTAFPYFYVIRNPKLIVTDSDYSYDVIKYYHPDYDDLTWKSEEEFIEFLRYDLSEEPYEESYIELELKNLKKVYLIKIWEEHGMFLTEEDAENHLKLNHYHYSSEAHTYVKHAWRAPDLQKFLDNLMNYFEIN